ncbi:MFS transporter [candidate division KSB1 bacterium]|nr:MFS transporter [candidate division KSB1 bacterium]
MNLNRTFHALTYRNYRLFFSGQAISIIGTWMQRLAMSWLVYRLSDSAFLLGLVEFTGQIPAVVLIPFAGVLLDRWNARSVLLISQTAAFFQALILAVLTLSGRIEIPLILLLSVFWGVIIAFDSPARQTLVIDLVPRREDMSNAIALNSTIFNSARLIGPSLAGLLIAWVGEGWCFLFNALTYLAIIAALLALRLPKRVRRSDSTGVWQGFVDGLRYAARVTAIRSILGLLTITAFAGLSYNVILPVMARDILGGGPETLGFLMGGAGIGALFAALLLAGRESVFGLERSIVRAALTGAIAIVLLALIRSFWAALLLMPLVGYGFIAQFIAGNTLLQTIVDDDKRGRIMSLYTLTFLGVTPLGSLLVGALAERIGAPLTLFLGGLVSLASAVAFLLQVPHLEKEINTLHEKRQLNPVR